jgi:hypothetical protein
VGSRHSCAESLGPGSRQSRLCRPSGAGSALPRAPSWHKLCREQSALCGEDSALGRGADSGSALSLPAILGGHHEVGAQVRRHRAREGPRLLLPGRAQRRGGGTTEREANGTGGNRHWKWKCAHGVRRVLSLTSPPAAGGTPHDPLELRQSGEVRHHIATGAHHDLVVPGGVPAHAGRCLPLPPSTVVLGLGFSGSCLSTTTTLPDRDPIGPRRWRAHESVGGVLVLGEEFNVLGLECECKCKLLSGACVMAAVGK